jgi:hypothetical protein
MTRTTVQPRIGLNSRQRRKIEALCFNTVREQTKPRWWDRNVRNSSLYRKYYDQVETRVLRGGDISL